MPVDLIKKQDSGIRGFKGFNFKPFLLNPFSCPARHESLMLASVAQSEPEPNKTNQKVKRRLNLLKPLG